MELELLVFAATAGTATFFSPCGFPMLAVYASYYLQEEDEGIGYSRGFVAGGATAVGYLGVFLALGGLVYAVGNAVTPHIPKLELFVGSLLMVFGVLILTGRSPSFSSEVYVPERGGLTGFFVFGVLYAVAASACVIPVFVSLITYAASQGSLVSTLTVFGVYAASMGAMMVVISLAIAGGKEIFVDKIKSHIGLIEKGAGVVMVVVGAYQIGYYITNFVL